MQGQQMTLLPRLTALSILLLLSAPVAQLEEGNSFTIAVIPDTQNYLDFRHQKAEGYEVDGKEMFMQQMRYVAANSLGLGGDIAFVSSVGDVWQHQTLIIDPAHQQRGIGIERNPVLGKRSQRTDRVINFELPTAFQGFKILDEAGIPFGVAPGNHDYDASWSVAGYPPNRTKAWSELRRTVKDFGILHIGGLENFRSVFGAETTFFKNKPWYVDSFRGGASSAQIFSGAGYSFLNIALEMQPDDDTLRWAEKVIEAQGKIPTIITTHDYLNISGERKARPLIDLARVDPEFHNNAEQLWQKFISKHDQIFLVLCGHNHGQSFRVDSNIYGNPVYQVLANYQGRGQAALDAGRPELRGLGDGWLRLMRFEFSNASGIVIIRTYSSHYEQYSSDIENYSDWYKAGEHPDKSDAEFHEQDEFIIHLDGFQQRFGHPRGPN